MCDQHNDDIKLNSQQEDPNTEKHHEEHHFWSRRGFLQTLGLAGGSSFVMGGSAIGVFNPSLLSLGLSQQNNDRILVMIRLKGGNDGLNTIIPLFDFSRYQNLRPNIAIPSQNAINLNTELGMHPAMNSLKSFWDRGDMKLINNVGYPDQNLSHFRSSDIWATSSNSNVVWDTGFLGRLFDDRYPEYLVNPPDIPPAVQIGGLGNLAFTGEDSINYAVTVATPELLEYIAQSGGLFDAEKVPDCFYGDQVAYLRTVANNTFKYASVISNAYNSGTNKVQYSGAFGNQLAITSRLIKGNLGTQLYMVTLDGFDTHAGQPNAHANLLSSLSDNIAAFFEDLQIDGYDERVLAFTFSEFGRRIQQNASLGTDHGAAAPMFVFGPGLNGNASLGGLPSLTDLDANGNLKHQVDFRSIYATLMDYWLCIEPNMVDLVLGNDFNRLNLGFVCLPSSSNQELFIKEQLTHQVRYDHNNQVYLYINTPSNAYADIEVFTAMGQMIRKIPQVYLNSGEHTIPLSPDGFRIPGYYVYKINYSNKIYSGKLLIR
jgi:uncharacterized protein (DUF1501 family)